MRGQLARLAKRTSHAVFARVIVMPPADHNAFLALLAHGDVVVDAHPFGGCTSSYEALLVGTPVASYPGGALRGRFTLALLRGAGLSERLIARSLDALVDAAVQVRVACCLCRRDDRCVYVYECV